MTSIRQLSLLEKVSYGWAHATIQSILSQGVVTRKENYVSISDTNKLLNGVAWERPFENLFADEINIDYQDAFKAASELSQILKNKGIKFAFTSYTAAGLYTGYAVRHDTVYLYLEKKEMDFFKNTFREKDMQGIKEREYIPRIETYSRIQEKKKGYWSFLHARRCLIWQDWDTADGILQKPWLINMPPYDPDPQIIEKSLHELEFILNWVRQRGETEENPVTVLVGGWAVDAYNPWYGSIDIDLVTNNRTKHSLMRILVNEREYDHFRIGTHTVYKQTEHGPIIIDFASREERYPFEGRDNELNFDILNGQTVLKVIRNRFPVAVPTDLFCYYSI